MALLKRSRDDSIDELPPAKVAKQIEGLRLDERDYEDPDIPDDEMQGIEARDFVHLTHRDFDDALNDIEVDDRFLKIPETIISKPPRQSSALILYESPRSLVQRESSPAAGSRDSRRCNVKVESGVSRTNSEEISVESTDDLMEP